MSREEQWLLCPVCGAKDPNYVPPEEPETPQP